MIGTSCALASPRFFRCVYKAIGTASVRLLLSPPRELIHLPPEHDRRVHILGSLPLFQTFIAILVNCNVGSGNHEEPSNHLDVGTPDVIAFPQHPHRLPLPTMAIFLGQDYLAYHLQIFPRQFAPQASPKNFQGFPTCPAQSNNAPVGRNNHNALKASSSQRETSRRRPALTHSRIQPSEAKATTKL